MSLARNQAVFLVGAVVLFSRLIEGQFPSWRQLIPESFEQQVRLPREELLEVTRRIGQLAQRNAPLRFAFAEGELTIAAETPEVGDASEAMPAPILGRAARDRLQPPVPDRGARERGRRRAGDQAELAAAARAAGAGRRGGLQLPRDADPAQRLGGVPMSVTARRGRWGFETSRRRGAASWARAITLLWGPNGAGKTNLLEAVCSALTGRSCRTRNEREAIAFGEQLARVEVEVRTPASHAIPLVAGAARGERRHLVDEKPVRRSTRAAAAWRLPAGSPGAGQGPPGRAARPSRPLRRGAVAGTRRGCARATAARSPSATRCSAGSGPARRRPDSLDAWDRELAEPARS